jgi:chromosome partitioning protein
MLRGKIAIMKYCLRSCRKSCYQSSMIIVIANSKGGVGKSTFAVHLAAWLHEQGHRVTLADCDTQQSSSEWIREAIPEIKAVRLASPDDILNDLPTLNADTDYVVADGPGSQTETSRALLLRADLAIVPCKASMLEVRALAKATEVLRVSQDIRAGLPKAIIVLSMVGKNYRLTQDMRDAASALNLPLASKPMILRQIYADAPGQGAVVWNMGSRAREAAEEVDHIFREILPDAAKRRVSRAAAVK